MLSKLGWDKAGTRLGQWDKRGKAISDCLVISLRTILDVFLYYIVILGLAGRKLWGRERSRRSTVPGQGN